MLPRAVSFGLFCRCAVLLAVATLLNSCQSPTRAVDWSQYDGPGARYFQQDEVSFPHVPDPIEPFNRAVSIFNHGLMTWIVRPIHSVYWFVTPTILQTGISNGLDNARFPQRLVGNFLQGKLSNAASETGRFLINSTVGLGGLIEVAEPIFGLSPQREDVGQAFGRWGWQHSTYLQLPLLGPTTVRDGIGLIGDAAVNPLTYVTWASTIQNASEVTIAYPTYARFVESNFDPYELGRLLFVLDRELSIADAPSPGLAQASGQAETLGIVYLEPEDPRFLDRSDTYEVQVPVARERLPYTCWIQDEAAPLIFLLPGTSGYRLADSTVAVAERAFGRGASVVTISGSFNHEFLAGGTTNPVPGFLPDDAADVYSALNLVAADLELRYPGRFEENILLGLSLGGMQTLYLAATENPTLPEHVKFDLFVAINAPVDTKHAITTLDRFYNSPLEYEPHQRPYKIRRTLRKALDAVRGMTDAHAPLNFSPSEAEFLIGLAFRTIIRDVIYQAQEQRDFGVLKTVRGNWTRTAPYREILQFSFMEYFYAFVLPYYAEIRPDVTFDETGAEHLLAACDLRAYAAKLCGNPKVLYFGNKNDSLLSPADVAWLQTEWSADQVVLFERGGHMGNLHRDDVQGVIAAVLEHAIAQQTETPPK